MWAEDWGVHFEDPSNEHPNGKFMCYACDELSRQERNPFVADLIGVDVFSFVFSLEARVTCKLRSYMQVVSCMGITIGLS